MITQWGPPGERGIRSESHDTAVTSAHLSFGRGDMQVYAEPF